ncbi:ABC transporter permease [Lutispora thermophila]|uniref:Spermidine/putrescine transport system permease protein n=1 Tax=Lutispora thermophila DSM 19022 TaxID=1122184 RepID=A0A1M6CCA2_9FIRM|nr:ABC transporter permease [Lutispora thermophila]SHI58503.1 spermidine/putrescine transport system permease protein [Lutispora thermophila DSM 19022]
MKKHLMAYPYALWMLIFTMIPLALILFYSVFAIDDAGIHFTLDNFKRVFEPLYLAVFWRSIKLAAESTIICLVLGYPMAMILAGKNLSKKSILVVLFVIPMWMNFLARTYAWMTLLEKNGLIATIAGFFGIDLPSLLYTEGAVVLGMVYNFLPFMVLPIYSVLVKIDKTVVEAAEDLGANPITVFRRVIFPLSIPGVSSGITMVFMPALTTFVISRLLGGAHFTLIGNLIEQQFLTTMDWGFGSALSIVLMLMIMLSMGVTMRYEKENEGGGLW